MSSPSPSVFCFAWAFRTLPREDWQILACIPGRKGADGIWSGVNFTYYGFFNALAFVVATTIFLLILGSIEVIAAAAGIIIAPVLAIGMWAARFIARWVEENSYVFSGGGFFCLYHRCALGYYVGECDAGRVV
jgi:hypothetical protein